MTGLAFVSTPPLSGLENMAYDLDTVEKVSAPNVPPTLRFFRWVRPTLSYGRLQRLDAVRGVIPAGWDCVQRPTGGGIVFHDQDLCFSLAWKDFDFPIPSKIKDIYPWIHHVVQEALAPWLPLQLATCCEGGMPSSFQDRQCFKAPVIFDLLKGSEKVVGGALGRRRGCFLYQGTIQAPLGPEAVTALSIAFMQRFQCLKKK